jgi:hypothetical protein
MYCSELVYEIYDRALGIKIGDLQRVRDFDLTDVAVQTKMKERYGSEVPTSRGRSSSAYATPAAVNPSPAKRDCEASAVRRPGQTENGVGGTRSHDERRGAGKDSLKECAGHHLVGIPESSLPLPYSRSSEWGLQHRPRVFRRRLRAFVA